MVDTTSDAAATQRQSPTLAEATKVWARIGLLSFGGPAAQIALMHREVVDERGWLTEQQYLNALSFCMFLPGPEAMQLATFAGWRLHGLAGGLIAGLLFVLPGAAVVLALAAVYGMLGDVPLVDALFLGVKAAVVLIVVEALLRVARRALDGPAHWTVAGLAFIAIFFLALPFPLIIGLAAAYGFLFDAGRATGDATVPIPAGLGGQTARTILVWLTIWWLPLGMIIYFGAGTTLPEIGVFFSKLAVVTFGGAYALLAYMAQDVVNQFGWLSAGEMMDGLGLAETTPGPLILVTEFVGFLAAFREGGLAYGLLGAMVALWVTFVPCFLWIFAGAPYIDWISAQPRLKGALAAISAAVVGVILNLTIWFALHVFFSKVNHQTYGIVHLWQPDPSSLDWRIVLLAAVCGVLMFRWHWNISRVLAVSALGAAALVYGAG
ncbi:MAG: chromate efflux transporter [Pseudomonadota bacterium]